MKKKTLNALTLIVTILVAFAISMRASAAPVEIDHAWVSSYDPAIFGSYCVTNLPTVLYLRVLNTTASGIKTANLRWRLFINVSLKNGKIASRRILAGSTRWKKTTAGTALLYQQDITTKLVKKLSQKMILSALQDGKADGRLDIFFKCTFANKNNGAANTSRPVTFSLDKYMLPGTVDVTRIVDATGATITDTTASVIMTISNNAVVEPTAISIVRLTTESGLPALGIESDKPINGFVSLQFSDIAENSLTFAPELHALRENEWPVVKSWKTWWISFRLTALTTTFRCNYNALPIVFVSGPLMIVSFWDTGARLLCSTHSEAAMNNKTPILFMHGYNMDLWGNIPLCGGGSGIPQGSTFGDLPAMLESQFGDRIIFFDFRYNSNARFQDIAGNLKEAVDYIADKTGRRVHIIAHSFGGLVARTFLQSMALGWNGTTPTDYDTARSDVASLITIGTPHSGIKDSAGEMHGVSFPKGQDAIYFVGARQLSVHQAGEPALTLLPILPLARVALESGEIPAELSRTIQAFPNGLPVYTLIGITSDRGSISVMDSGDGLISFEGQRFLHDGDHKDLLVRSNVLGAVVTERILGMREGELIKPGDPNPWSSQNSDRRGYMHNSLVGIDIGSPRSRARLEVDLDSSSDTDHATYLNIVAWLSGFIGQYTISGHVVGDTQQGVTMNLTGAATAQTATDGNGNYSFSRLANGIYTITPSKSGFTFDPLNANIPLNGANVNNVNFRATQSSYSISGRVSGDTQQGVKMNLTGSATDQTTTDGNGNYTFSGLANGNYTITPSKSGFTFDPKSANIPLNGANVNNVNFRATQSSYSISGRVSGDTQQNVTMNLTGAATAQTTTDGNGNYSFSGLANGNYTIRPSKSGFTFDPSSANIPLNGANVNNVNFRATQSGGGDDGGGSDYMIIDISGGPTAVSYPVTYHTNAPPQDDAHKTSKIVLRKIPAGRFVMGSPGNELGRNDHDETQHTVTLTKPFYMGIYEITQAQYQNVMGSNPSYFKAGAHAPKRPVEQVLWDMVRGGGWPGGSPADTTFMGKLRSKTGHAFDLPTEAQWEYACRAGTTKALNNNTALKDTEQDPNMDILGRYWDNGGRLWRSDGVNGAHTTVGSYQANNWGLYDMHGNVWEWCLDWYDWRSYDGDATDPTGPPSGSYRVKRGGGWSSDARWCRSACKFEYSPDMTYNDIGFRLVLPIGQ